jgi:hypothetical protein
VNNRERRNNRVAGEKPQEISPDKGSGVAAERTGAGNSSGEAHQQENLRMSMVEGEKLTGLYNISSNLLHKACFPGWKLMPAVLFSAGDIWNYCRRKRILRAA